MKLEIRELQGEPAPFHDGMHEEKARLHIECGLCGYKFDVNLLSGIDKGEKWYRSLSESEQRYVASAFNYRFELVGPNKIPYARLENGSAAYFIGLECPECYSVTLAVVNFYEMQPARYIAILAGVASIEAN